MPASRGKGDLKTAEPALLPTAPMAGSFMRQRTSSTLHYSRACRQSAGLHVQHRRRENRCRQQEARRGLGWGGSLRPAQLAENLRPE